MTEHSDAASEYGAPKVPRSLEEAAAEAAIGEQADEIVEFWEAARSSVHVDDIGVVTGHSALGAVVPQAWSFGDSPALAQALLEAVLSGRKTATTTALAEFDGADTALPQVGELSIILDGEGHPRALIRTTEVRTVPFDEVDAEFAADEGEDDGSLESWQEEHRKYFVRVLGDRFSPDMPVVCERFELRYPR